MKFPCTTGHCSEDHEALGMYGLWCEGDQRTSPNGERNSLDRKGPILDHAEMEWIQMQIGGRVSGLREGIGYLGMPQLGSRNPQTSPSLCLRDGALVIMYMGDRTVCKGKYKHIGVPAIAIVGESEEVIRKAVRGLGILYDSNSIEQFVPNW